MNKFKHHKSKKIFIAGQNGMVGSALVRHLSKENQVEILHVQRRELDLCDENAVLKWFKTNKPDHVYLAAAKVGGIHANNSFPADFISINLKIQTNIIESAFRSGVEKLLFLGSSCIYPKLAEQPIREESLLTGPLESTNEPYAIAKIAGIKLCESFNRQYGVDYRCVMPTNLYGSNDNFHLDNAHVIPAMMHRMHMAKLSNAKEVVIWGSGNPRREFLHVDDMAAACTHIMNLSKMQFEKELSNKMCSHINIGTGVDCSIKELAETMVDITGFKGKLTFDINMPDGTPRKLLSVQKLKNLGWKHSIELSEGLKMTYKWYQDNFSNIRFK